MDLQKIFSLIEEQQDDAIDELADFIAIASVSAKEQQLPEAAEYSKKLLDEIGFETKIHETQGGPVVTGYYDAGAKRTLMFYDHADVQPAEPFELWDSPPFELSQQEGKLYGRGVADNKGEIVVRTNAIKAWLNAGYDLPCNIKFIIETEEESSSKNLSDYIKKDQEFLKDVDGCIWEFGSSNAEGKQLFILGVKGILYVQLSVKLMSKDAHSGNAPMLPNAGEKLLQAVASLKNDKGKIIIPHFYDNVEEISAAEQEVIDNYDFNSESFKENYGIEKFRDGKSDDETKQALFTEPTCNLCGFSAGWQGEGGKTVIPKEAIAKIDFRLVKNQDPERILELLRKHLDENGFSVVKIDWHNGYPPSKTDVREDFVQICINANEKVYGHTPEIQSTSGGSGPMYLFGQHMPIVSLGSGHHKSNAHSPNENIKIDDFINGMKCVAALLEQFKKWD